MSLTVCLLTRNDERNLGAALQSVAGLADEIVVADTASTDATARVAAQMGANVLQFDWTEDFAAGRNFTVGQAHSEWILWLNADETVVPETKGLFRDCLARDDAFGYFLTIQTPIDPQRPQAYSETLDLRVFRRRADLQFIGRCHPRLLPEVVAAVKQSGQQVLPSAICLRSKSGLVPRTDAKLRWTTRLLELELRDRPGQLHYLIELGRTLLLLKEPRGHGILADAEQLVLAARTEPAAPARKIEVLLDYLLTVAPEFSQCQLSRDEACELALRWFPASPPLVNLCAQHCFRKGDFLRAAVLLERLVQFGRTGSYDKSRNFDPRIIGETALLNLGACYRNLGERARAEECYRQLLGSKDFHAPATAGLAAVQGMQQ